MNTISTYPVRHLIRRIARLKKPDIRDFAVRSWQIAPEEGAVSPPAIFLPDQLDRITDHEFADADYKGAMAGGFPVRHAATRGYLIRDAFLIDGVLYKNDSAIFLDPKRARLPRLSVEEEIPRGAMYASPGGLRYFGQWLIDDCVTYRMTASDGEPATVARDLSLHERDYERILGMEPARVESAHFKELVIYDDFGKNSHKRRRFLETIGRLSLSPGTASSEGVFLLRRDGGQRRVMLNELDVAERLRRVRGFAVIDPMASSVEEIRAACADAKLVVGVEGSHLVHGVMTARNAAAILTIQPPFRFCTALKDVADYVGLRYGLVVGTSASGGFIADADEIERTIDLTLAAASDRSAQETI